MLQEPAGTNSAAAAVVMALAGLLILGMCFQTIIGMMHGHTTWWTVLVRLVLIYVFLLFTSPIATHALARAGLAGGVEPWTGEGEGA